MTNPLGPPTIGERQAIAEAIRKAKFEADKTYGIAWHHLEEISRVELIIAALATATTNAPVAAQPIDMLLFCPKCGKQHIDEPEPFEATIGIDTVSRPDWTNPPHRSHLCHECGCIWRPADVATNGVASIATVGTADTWVLAPLTKNVATNADMRGALEAIDRIVEENIVENDRPDRVLWKGQWIDGAAAEMVHSLLRAMQRVARTVLQGDQP